MTFHELEMKYVLKTLSSTVIIMLYMKKKVSLICIYIKATIIIPNAATMKEFCVILRELISQEGGKIPLLPN